VQAGVEVSTYSGYDVCHATLVNAHTHTAFDRLYTITSASSAEKVLLSNGSCCKGKGKSLDTSDSAHITNIKKNALTSTYTNHSLKYMSSTGLFWRKSL